MGTIVVHEEVVFWKGTKKGGGGQLRLLEQGSDSPTVKAYPTQTEGTKIWKRTRSVKREHTEGPKNKS